MIRPSGAQLQSNGTGIKSERCSPFKSTFTILHSVLPVCSSRSLPITAATCFPSGDHSAPEKPLKRSPSRIFLACSPLVRITQRSCSVAIRESESVPYATHSPSREIDQASPPSNSLRGACLVIIGNTQTLRPFSAVCESAITPAPEGTQPGTIFQSTCHP